MDFTFGIVTNGTQWDRVDLIVDSIIKQNIPKFQILVVGGKEKRSGNFTHMPFDESTTKKGWITYKKNIITDWAAYDNVVYVHDYFSFDEGWYEGWLEFGDEFTVATNCIRTLEGYRHSDWVVDPDEMWSAISEIDNRYWDLSLPYDINLTKIQYISGNYWVAKQHFMDEHRLDESLLWGDAEDLEWSRRIRNQTQFKFNPNSLVSIMKPGKWAPGLIPDEYLTKLIDVHNLKNTNNK